MQELKEEQKLSGGKKAVTPERNYLKISLNAGLFLMLAAAAYFAYAYIRQEKEKALQKENQTVAQRVVQLDVLNGSGVNGMASKFTEHLRKAGFDVVESKNYKSSQVAQTLVVDRIGNLAAARRVAEAIGVSANNIIQQINPDYYVDVSVIIGGDYRSLMPLH